MGETIWMASGSPTNFSVIAPVVRTPTLALDVGQDGSSCIEVRDLDSGDLAALCAGHLLATVLRVSIVPTQVVFTDELPAVFGRYEVRGGTVRFHPHFPFEAGLLYRAKFDARPPQLAGRHGVLTLDFSPAMDEAAVPVEVTHVFPSGESLPENLLRFYVRFAGPMQRGRCDAEITLLGPDGKVAPDVLYRPPVELWDRSMQYLTVLLDPGRLKRMVGPNRKLGPPLKVGEPYTLVIGPGMIDAFGQRLPRAFHKRFQVTAAVRSQIETARWQIEQPATGTRDSLVLSFPHALDWALLANAVSVEPVSGQAMPGRIAIEQHERCWRFTPSSNWLPGDYRIHVASDLEDVCGNSVSAAFDRPIRSDGEMSHEVAETSIAFRLS